MDGIALAEGINFLLVFFEGALSFFSPCVVPLLPLYISYLAGSAKSVDADGMICYDRARVFLQTVFFVLGIGASFFILGLAFSALGRFFQSNQTVFTSIGGVIIILLGLFQLGLFQTKYLSTEHKLPFHFKMEKMNPLIAFVMGFTFSFAWTPCVGPMLSSVLILASNASSALLGNLLVGVYCLGFIIPFLLLGLFTARVLNFLKRKRNWLKYTVRAGGILLIVIGLLMVTGFSQRINGYFGSLTNSFDNQSAQPSLPAPQQTATPTASSAATSPTPEAQSELAAFDFTLSDQYDTVHTLSQYKGKIVFLNFWASWCGPCQWEMPHIEQLYREYGENSGDVIFLGVANPGGQDVDTDELKAFLSDNGYTFPTVFDQSGSVFYDYYIRSFPTTFTIDKDGNIFGYVAGALTKEQMVNLIENTRTGRK